MLTQLRQLARLYGIQTSYIDVHQRKHEADSESLMLILSAMGAPVRSMKDVASALKQRREALAVDDTPSVIVAWNGRTKGIPRGEVVLENGLRHNSARTLPPGYHQLRSRGHSSLIISAPIAAYFPFRRMEWGIFAPIYALRSQRSYGAGDLTDFEAISDWTMGFGGRVAATLPLLAGFLDEPFEPSPYAPASRLFWNEFYIDMTRVPEFAQSPAARRQAETLPRRTAFVDYRTQMSLRQDILRRLARTIFSSPSEERRAAFDRFIEADPEVERYAEFRAAMDRTGRGWQSWPPRMRLGRIESGDYREADRSYHLYAQWVVQ
jgi:4-alpha-glucanotransferase